MRDYPGEFGKQKYDLDGFLQSRTINIFIFPYLSGTLILPDTAENLQTTSSKRYPTFDHFLHHFHSLIYVSYADFSSGIASFTIAAMPN